MSAAGRIKPVLRSTKASKKRFPLSKALLSRFEDLKHSSRKAGNSLERSAHVVSPQLCDDALGILKPAFVERHKGCHILDFYPGVGLWSSKVHDLLKPKSHKLIEPDKDIYLPFLQPLLDQPGSAYHLEEFAEHVSSVPAATRLIESWLPPLEHRTTPNKKNDKILIIATATRPGLKGLTRNTHHKNLATNYLLWNYLRCLREREGVHSFGSVRLLAWVLQAERYEYIPRSTLGTNERTFSTWSQCKAREIVSNANIDISAPSPVDTSKGAKGDTSLELRSAINILRKTEEHGFKPNIKRLSHLTRLLSDPFESKKILKDLNELVELEKRVALDASDRPRKPRGRPIDTPEWTRIDHLHEMFKRILDRPRYRWVNDKARAAAKVEIRIIELERLFTQNEVSKATKEEALVRRKELQNLLKSKRLKMQDKELCVAMDIVDDTIAMEYDPPRLAWDTREFEPLNCDTDEFWPRQNLALLDLDPWDGSYSSEVIAKPLIQVMLRLRMTNLKKTLEGIQLGASELIEKCPSITDPWQGGRLDYKDMRMSMMTVAMYEQLAKAWEDWPFRIPDHTLLRGEEPSSYA